MSMLKKLCTHTFLVLLMILPKTIVAELTDKDFLSSLQSLFSFLELPPITSLQEANIFAQQHFLLSHHQWFEHPETDLQQQYIHKKENILLELKKLDMIDPIFPQKKEYTYALVMGSFKHDVLERLQFLAQLFKKGISCKTIVLLSGQRLLTEDERRDLPEQITTEYEMFMHLYLSFEAFKHHPHSAINALPIQQADGSFTRPTTASTVTLFINQAPMPGSCLVLSNNPFIQRQTHVVRRILDQKLFPTEGAGPGFNDDSLDISMLMDELARTLYERCGSQ